MQTFLPYESFLDSARCLDMKRLGKQRSEAMQILKTLRRQSNGWRDHPAVKMWAGAEVALATYGMVTCQEWKARGYKDVLEQWFKDELETMLSEGLTPVRPNWLGDDSIHRSHRAALLEKHWDHYKKFQWKEKPQIFYVWPEGNAPMPEPMPEIPLPTCCVCGQARGGGSMVWSTLFAEGDADWGRVHERCSEMITEAARAAGITLPFEFKAFWDELRSRKKGEVRA